ncbi:hypothetical protein DDD63_01000 [Actinobaculum sp. 313]|nr:hypothetical protein DDD63_01000 [Actinobaculum sp. 313]
MVAEQPLPQRELSEDTELLWCRAFERRSWMLNSDSGPTIVTRTTAQLLDPATGQTVWTYTRRSDSSQQLITSAEVRDSGSTVALEYEVSSSAYRYPETVLLDAETGETLGWEHAELLSNGSGGREPDAGLTWVNPMYPHGNKMDDASAFDVIFDADGNSFTIVLDARILPQDTYLIEKRLYDAGSMYLLEVLPASSADTKLVCGLY